MIFGAVFGFLGKNWKLVAIAVALGAFYMGWRHYQGLVADNATLKADRVTLKSVLTTQRATTKEALIAIDEWERSRQELQKKIFELQEVSKEARSEGRRLDELFTNHDLQKLALAKPGLIERRINAGTARSFRLLEATTADTSGHNGS